MEVDTSPNSKSPNQIGAKKRKKLILRLYGLPAFCNLRDLKTFLQNYGPIKHLIVSKGRKSATVAYANSEHAQRVLDFKTIRFGEDILEIHESDWEFVLSHKDVLRRSVRCLEGMKHDSGFSEEVALLKDKIGLKKENMQHRIDFCTRLNAYVQEYFEDKMHILPFGSSLTGLGHLDADLDVCLYFDYKYSSEKVDVSTVDLSTIDLDEVKERKLKTSVFMLFKPKDRTELVARILQRFENETAELSDISFVTSARVPLIKFNFDHIPVDMTLFNVLSSRKANFLKMTADFCPGMHDLLYFIRLWARCAELYKDKENPLGAWSSYAISLLFFGYCQKARVYGELDENMTINGVAEGNHLIWTGDTIKDVHEFVKGFFEFAVETLSRKDVICLNDSSIYSFKEFRKPDECYGSYFRISDVCNIQDPIEITHNVTQSLSQPYFDRFISKAEEAVEVLSQNKTEKVGKILLEKLLESVKPSRSHSRASNHHMEIS